MTAIDYSDARFTSAQLRAVGVTDVFRYFGPPAWEKCIQQEEYDELTGGGIRVWGVFEQGANDSAGGYGAGLHNAGIALAFAPKGYAGPIFLACDEALTGVALQTGVEYIAGASTVLTPERTGVYGEGALCQACHDDGYATFFWQSASTSFPGNSTTLPITHVQQGLGGPLPDTDADTILLPLTPPAPSGTSLGTDELEILMSLAASLQDAFDEYVRFRWGQIRKSALTPQDTNVLWYCYNLPVAQGGWQGRIDAVLANIIDQGTIHGDLKPDWAGAA